MAGLQNRQYRRKCQSRIETIEMSCGHEMTVALETATCRFIEIYKELGFVGVPVGAILKLEVGRFQYHYNHK